MERAVKQRWITDDLKPSVVDTIREALKSGDERVRIRAAKIVIDMESQNQRDEHKIIDVNVATRHDHLSAIAADLGIEASLIADAAREADSSLGGADAQGQDGSEE